MLIPWFETLQNILKQLNNLKSFAYKREPNEMTYLKHTKLFIYIY